MKDEIRYGGLWDRFLALVIDFLLFCAFFFPITRKRGRGLVTAWRGRG